MLVRKWKVIYYTDSEGNTPVEEFINSRSQSNKSKIMALLDILEERGPNFPRPYADFLRDGIHELRIKLSGDQFRILYFFLHKDNIILSNAFMKNTKKVPTSEIKKALLAKDDYIRRFNEYNEV